MPKLEIYSFAKKFLWNSSQTINIVIKELLRLSYGLANQSFCHSDIQRVQLKSTWTVGERRLAFGQETVREWRLK